MRRPEEGEEEEAEEEEEEEEEEKEEEKDEVEEGTTSSHVRLAPTIRGLSARP